MSLRRVIAGYHVGDVRRLLSLFDLRAEESEKQIEGLRAQLLDSTAAVDALTAELAQKSDECAKLKDEAERARLALRILRTERNAVTEPSGPQKDSVSLPFGQPIP